MRGKAVCCYYNSDQHYKRETETHGKQLYLNSSNYLFGSASDEPQTFAEGIHTFTFSCELPSDIPYSIEARYSSIRYKVVANLKFPTVKDFKTKKTFIVARSDDLNLFPYLRFPFEAEKIESFIKCFCKPGTLIMKVSLPKIGYALGEMIPITVELINESSLNVLHTAIALKKHEKFIGTAGDILETRTTVLKVHSSGAKKRNQNICHVDLGVSKSLPTSNDRYCKIYQINYEVKVTAVLKGLNRSPFIRVPIVIGTIGLDNSNSSVQRLKYMNHPNFRIN